jgi:hypothetical protein
LITSAKEAIDALKHRDALEAEAVVRELLARLQDAQDRYEAALKKRGFELPY